MWGWENSKLPWEAFSQKELLELPDPGKLLEALDA